MSTQITKEMDVAAQLLKAVHGSNKRLVKSLLGRSEPALPESMPDGSEASIKTLFKNMKKGKTLETEGNPGAFDACAPPKPRSARDRELDKDLIAMGVPHIKKRSKTAKSVKRNEERGENEEKKGGKASTATTAAVQAKSSSAPVTRKARMQARARAALTHVVTGDGVQGKSRKRKLTHRIPNTTITPITVPDSNSEPDFEVNSLAEYLDLLSTNDKGTQDVPSPRPGILYPPARGTIVPSTAYNVSNIRAALDFGCFVFIREQNKAIHPPIEEQQFDAEQRIIDTALERHPPWDIAKKARKAAEIEYDDVHALFSGMRAAVQRTAAFEALVRQDFLDAIIPGLNFMGGERDVLDFTISKAFFWRMEEVMKEFLEQFPPKGSKEERSTRTQRAREAKSRRKADAEAREKEALQAAEPVDGSSKEVAVVERLPAGLVDTGRMTRAQKKLLQAFLADSAPAQPEPQAELPQQAKATKKAPRCDQLSEPLVCSVWARYRNSLPPPAVAPLLEDVPTTPETTKSPTEILQTPFSEFIGGHIQKLQLTTLSGPSANSQLGIEESFEDVALVSSHAEADLARPEREASIVEISDEDTPVQKRPCAKLLETSIADISDEDTPVQIRPCAKLPSISPPLFPVVALALSPKTRRAMREAEMEFMLPKRPTVSPLTPEQPSRRRRRVWTIPDSSDSDTAPAPVTKKTKLEARKTKSPAPLASLRGGEVVEIIVLSSDDDESELSDDMSDLTIKTPAKSAGPERRLDWSKVPTPAERAQRSLDRSLGRLSTGADDSSLFLSLPTPTSKSPVGCAQDDEDTEIETTAPRQPKPNKGKEWMRDDVLIVEDENGNELHLDRSNFGDFERERARMAAAYTREIHNVWTLGEELAIADYMNHGIEDTELMTFLYNQKLAGARLGLVLDGGDVWFTVKPRQPHEVRELMMQLEAENDMECAER